VYSGIILAAAQFPLAYLVWKYRARHDGRKATYFHGNKKAAQCPCLAMYNVSQQLFGGKLRRETGSGQRCPNPARTADAFFAILTVVVYMHRNKFRDPANWRPEHDCELQGLLADLAPANGIQGLESRSSGLIKGLVLAASDHGDGGL
jgi:hypothetical protein